MKYIIFSTSIYYDELVYDTVLTSKDTTKGLNNFEYIKSIVNNLKKIEVNNMKLGLLLMLIGINTYKYRRLNQYDKEIIEDCYIGDLQGDKVFILKMLTNKN